MFRQKLTDPLFCPPSQRRYSLPKPKHKGLESLATIWRGRSRKTQQGLFFAKVKGNHFKFF